ncbi:MAG: riboflavin biosynthesis protein RibF [Opitutales bacterium]
MGAPIHFSSLEAFQADSDKSVHLAIGMFDGAHRGHRVVVESAIRAAAEQGGLAGVLTFWPHPSRLFSPDNPVQMILNSEMKQAELEKLRIDFVIEEPFTKAFASTESNGFVKMLKVNIPTLATLHTGENWRFGKGRLGDVGFLGELATNEGVQAYALDCLYVDGERVSSTRIRKALSDGRMNEANRLLGYRYESIGTVAEGKRIGRTIGVPTLNLPFEGDLPPRYGVYAVRVSRENGEERLRSVANFGVRPTVNSLKSPLLEAHVLEDCQFSYGERLRVEWETFIRPEMRFDSIDILKEQIGSDIDAATTFFKGALDG